MRRSTMIAAGFAAGFAAVAASLAAAAPAAAAFGAFAYDEATGKYGYSWNQKTEKLADEAALKGCAADGCKIVFRTKPRQCGAIATAEKGKAWGGARRPTRAAAELAALQSCQKHTSGQCKVRGAECNTGSRRGRE